MSALSDALDAASLAIATKIDDMLTDATPKDVALLANATAALQGGPILQAIVEAGGAAQSGLADSLASSLTSLATALTNAQNDVNDSRDAAITALSDAEDEALTDHLAELLLSGALRVGDIDLRIVPSSASLPGNLAICDGHTIPTADCPALIAAWGVGGSLCEFATRYNASARGTAAPIAIVSGSLRLPNLVDWYFRPKGSTEQGTFFDQTRKNGTLKCTVSSSGTLVIAQGSDTENRPLTIGALPLVRYK